MRAVTNENRCCKRVCVFTFYIASVYIRIFTLWSLYVASHQCNVYLYDVKSNPWSEQKAPCDSLWVEMLKEIVRVCSCMCVGNWGEETENGVGVWLNKRSLSAALETISSAGDISIKASPCQPRRPSNENHLSNFLIQDWNLLRCLSDPAWRRRANRRCCPGGQRRWLLRLFRCVHADIWRSCFNVWSFQEEQLGSRPRTSEP